MKSDRDKVKKFVVALAGASAAVGFSMFAYSCLKKKYTFLSVQEIGPDRIEKRTWKQFLYEDDEPDISRRLVRARSYYNVGEYDLAGFLAFSTWENQLRDFVQSICGSIGEDRGILNLLKRIRSRDLINRNDYEKAKRLISEARNPLFHGKGIYAKDLVRETLDFVDRLNLDLALKVKDSYISC